MGLEQILAARDADAVDTIDQLEDIEHEGRASAVRAGEHQVGRCIACAQPARPGVVVQPLPSLLVKATKGSLWSASIRTALLIVPVELAPSFGRSPGAPGERWWSRSCVASSRRIGCLEGEAPVAGGPGAFRVLKVPALRPAGGLTLAADAHVDVDIQLCGEGERG